MNGGNNMGYKRGKQESSHDQEDRSKVVQKVRVRIYLVWAHIDLQISDEMTENVHNQNKCSNADHDFFSNRRLVKCDGRIIGELPDSNGGPTCCGHSEKLLKIFKRCQQRWKRWQATRFGH
jgi:hypothetical protein